MQAVHCSWMAISSGLGKELERRMGSGRKFALSVLMMLIRCSRTSLWWFRRRN